MVSGRELPAAGNRVVVAMSGGVDSSVVAALCAEAGCETIGVTLRLYDDGRKASRPGACCAGADIADARQVAAKLGIAHYVIDLRETFRNDVILPFADAYVAGQTPVPCVSCNQTVKFRDLLRIAGDLGAATVATGHYARRLQSSRGAELYRAVDPLRDQSYFLAATTRAQLSSLCFPLGGMTKPEVRGAASRFGLANAGKADSQDICFVRSASYADVVGSLRPAAAAPGEVVDLEGNVLGHHPGVARFTVGQRRGLGIGGAPTPLHVVGLDAVRRRVTVGPRVALAVESLELRDVNWLGAPADVVTLGARVRSSGAIVPAQLQLEGRPTLRFDRPQFGVAPGQLAAFYDGDRVLGAGFVVATQPGRASPEPALALQD